MTRFRRRAFVFVSSRRGSAMDRVQIGLVQLFAELVRRGASVHLISPPGTALNEPAVGAGVTVAPYGLSRANFLRTVSRMRKYLRRMDPVVAHSVGVEAAVLLRLAARPLAVQVVNTILGGEWPASARRRATARALRSADRRTARLADLVLVDSEELRDRLVRDGGYDISRIAVLPELSAVRGRPADADEDVERLVRSHLAAYQKLMQRWGGPAPVRGPKRRITVRGVRRDARRAARRDRS